MRTTGEEDAMREVPYDPLTLAVEELKQADAPPATMELETRSYHVQRAQALAMMEVAESLNEIHTLLLERLKG
jgi:hypothetical protein